MLIRRILPDEGPNLRDIRLRALRDAPEAFGGKIDESANRPDSHWDDWARRASSGDDECVWVAETEGTLIGLIGAFTVRDRPDHRHLVATWTDPVYRNRGIATKLTQAIIDWCKGFGAARLGLWVVDGNTTAQHLYERTGFVMTDVAEPLPSNPDLTERLMVLDFDT